MTSSTPAHNSDVAATQDVASQLSGLAISALENVYDTLATAIDQAGTEKAELFLVKLALLQANALADDALFAQHVETALQDL
jgi:hypothetical protein